MAARHNARMTEEVRSRIQTTQLINRLQAFANNDPDVQLDQLRLKAIELLLKKSLPDLSSVTIEGNKENGDIGFTVTWQSPTDK
jgi:hypothetical protein